MKKMLTSILLLVGISAQAQTTTATATTPTAASTPTTTSETSVKPFANSPFSLNLETESITGRRNGQDEITQINTNIYPMLSYQVVPNSIVTAYANYYIYRDNDRPDVVDYDAHNEYVALKFTQEDIFTAEDDGFDFKADARYYDHVTTKSKKANEVEGTFNIRTYLDKKLTDKLSINNHNRFYFYDHSDSFSNDKVPTNINEIHVTPNLQVTDKFTTGVDFKYLNKIAKDQSDVTRDALILTPNVGYTFSDKFSFLTEVEFTALKSNDGKFFANSNVLVTPQFSYTFTDQLSALLLVEVPVVSKAGHARTGEMAKNATIELDLSILAF